MKTKIFKAFGIWFVRTLDPFGQSMTPCVTVTDALRLTCRLKGIPWK